MIYAASLLLFFSLLSGTCLGKDKVTPIHIPERDGLDKEIKKKRAKPKKERWWSMAVGGFFRSQSVKRGAQLWPGPSASAGPTLTFFKTIQLRGPSVAYSPFSRRSPHEFETSVQLFDDDKPFGALGEHEEDYRNRRQETWESTFKYTYGFGFRNMFKVGGRVIQDLDENEGRIGELILKFPVYKYTSLKTQIGFADGEQATYLYGPEAASGPAYHHTSLTFVWPEVLWEGIIINRLEWSSLFQRQNRQAEYVRGDDQHVTLSFLVIWNVI